MLSKVYSLQGHKSSKDCHKSVNTYIKKGQNNFAESFSTFGLHRAVKCDPVLSGDISVHIQVNCPHTSLHSLSE